MLRRAKRLHSTFDEFCSQYDQDHFALSQEEWRQIEYLLCITQPFFKFTTLLSKTKDISIHLIFSIYNKLFTHLEKSKSALKRKKAPWKQLMLASLEAAEKKLSQYYSMTDTIDNNLYAIGTILSPQQKLQFFEGKDWDDPDNNWRAIYRVSLEDYFQSYKRRHLDAQSTSKARSSAVAISELEMECGVEDSQPLASGEYDELKEYLDSGKWVEFLFYPAYTNFYSRYYTNSYLCFLEGSPASVPRPCKPCTRCTFNTCYRGRCGAPFQLRPGCLSLPARLSKAINNSRSYDVYVHITI